MLATKEKTVCVFSLSRCSRRATLRDPTRWPGSLRFWPRWDLVWTFPEGRMSESTGHILIVDDREENRYISSRILRSAGYSVEEASTGRQGLEKILQQPALVILDVRLPDVLGYEVCRRIKENPQTVNIPVLLVSAAFVTSESQVQALDAGADAYLIQPLEPTVLIATVRALLRLRKAEAGSKLAAKQWQSTFDALSEGIALLDSDWRVVRCNRSLAQLLNKPY